MADESKCKAPSMPATEPTPAVEPTATTVATDASERTPATPRRLPSQQAVALWFDLMDTCEQLLLARLRQKVGENGDLAAAYREWYARQMDEHDEMMARMAMNLSRASNPDAR